MRLLRFNEMNTVATEWKWGCVLLETPMPNWDKITSLIDPDHLYMPGTERFGITKDPHCTILFFIKDEMIGEGQIEKTFDGLEIPTLTTEGIGFFSNPMFDVVKINIRKSQKLNILNKAARTLPHKSKYREYIPHITIAFVKKGLGKMYQEKLSKMIDGKSIRPTELKYEAPGGKRISISKINI